MEMALDGWKFLVLSPAFAIHWGFQEKIQQSKLRKMQVNKNRRRFNEFEKEIREKYAARNSKGATPTFNGNESSMNADKKLKTFTSNHVKLKTEGITQRTSIMRTPDFQPVTRPLFYEYDLAGPRFDDNMV